MRHASRSVMMAQGSIVESGTHAALLARQQGIYAHLWRMQDGGNADAAPLATVATTMVVAP